MKKSLLLAVILLFSVIMLLVFGCSKSSYNGSGGGGADPANTIYMKGSVFSIPRLTISSGTKITWINDDDMIHTVTADNVSFSSGDMNPGDSFSYTFNTVGTYNYHCMRHIGMTAVVTVLTR